MGIGTVRNAQIEDLGKLSKFLQEAQLSTDGLADCIQYFLFYEGEDGRIAATLGIEPIGEIGLLRSLVMTAGVGEKEILMLLEQMLLLARDRGLTDLYLASNKESSFLLFTLLGFKPRDSRNLPDKLLGSTHVQHILSVDNCYFLHLSI